MSRLRWFSQACCCIGLAHTILAIPLEKSEVEAKSWWTQKQYKRYQTRTIAHEGAQQLPETRLSRFGGDLSRQHKATGFFRCEQLEGRWIMVDPEGYEWFQVGCNGVGRNKTPNGMKALEDKFGTNANWALETKQLLIQLGYNVLGNWSEVDLFRRNAPFPYTKGRNFMGDFGRELGVSSMGYGHHNYEGGVIPVFHPDFPAHCRKYARKHCQPHRDDPYLVGYFSDNEMPFTEDLLEKYLALPQDNTNRQACIQWLKTRDLKPSTANYDEATRHAFLQHVVSTYCRIVSEAIRNADPNHLYLGCRFLGRDAHLSALWKGASPYVDVISLNLYKVWTPEYQVMDQWATWSDRPFFISEWYAKGMDTGMPNTGGAGWIVKTQADRGRFYQNFTLGLLQHPSCVGWHWFLYKDNDPSNDQANPSNRDSNKGFVTAHYEPYEELLPWMRTLNRRVYALREHALSNPF